MSDGDGTCEYVLDPENPETWGGEEGDGCYVEKDILNEDGVWTCPHNTEKNEDVCIFHLPIEKKDNNETVDAFVDIVNSDSSSSHELSKKTPQFLGGIFENFNIDENIGLNEGVVISLSHSTIKGELHWSDIIVNNSCIDMSGVHFKDIVDFEETKFNTKVDFTGAEFCSSTNFEGSEFEREFRCLFAKANDVISFTGALFADIADFERTKFDDFVSFQNSKFEQSAKFSSVVFADGVSMIGTKCGSNLRFNDVNIKGMFALKNAEINGGANFSETAFEYKSSFKNVEFGSEADFRWTYFENSSLFSQSKFNNSVDFRWSEFNSDIIFDKSKFIGFADFQEMKVENGSWNKVTFENEVVFDDVEFSSTGEFRDTNFTDDVKFHRVEFDGDTGTEEEVYWDAQYDFSGTQFRGNADFSESQFTGNTRFQSSEFNGQANFSRTTFESNISFVSSIFNKKSNFSRSDFNPDKSVEVEFSGAIFNEEVDFISTVFQGPNFNNTIFKGDANFTGGCEFNDITTFHSAEFRGSADFSEVEFMDASDFRHTKLIESSFADSIIKNADFGNAHIENSNFTRADISNSNLEKAMLSNSDMSGADLSGVQFYGANIGGITINVETVFDKHGKYRCVYDPNSEYEYNPDDDETVGKLRKAMGAYHLLEQLTRANTLPDEQGKFFARRQDMRRAQLREDGRRLEYWFAEAQNAVFRHGESFSRVVGWSIGTIVAFAFIFPLGEWLQSGSTGTLTYGAIAESPELMWQSFYHSTLLFLTGGGPLTPTGFIGEVLTTIEALIAPILLALLIFVLGRRAAR